MTDTDPQGPGSEVPQGKDAPEPAEAGTADYNALRAAADAIRDGAPIPDGALPIIADLLDAEAVLMVEIVNLAELFGAVLHQASGGKADLKVLRNKETGDVKFVGANISNGIRLARAILNDADKL